MNTKRQVRDILDLDESPDNDFMEALAAAGEDEIVAGVPPVEGEEYTVAAIRAELQEAMDAEGKG